MLFSLFVFLFPLLALVAGQHDLECPNTDLTAYLLQLIDGLYANGLTTFESLLVAITAHDDGYNLLQSIYLDQDHTYTILVPTDAAFQMAGVWAPFERQSPGYLLDLVGLHVIKGHWGNWELPEKGMAVGKSLMRLGIGNKPGVGESLTGKEEGAGGWEERVVMKRAEGGAVTVKTARGDVTSWATPPDMRWLNLLDNLVLLPIDHVLPFPPNISTALTLPTTTRSPAGLPNLQAAIQNVSSTGADALAQITQGGLTFFAPVDDAWDEGAWGQVGDKSLRAKLLGNHYTINQSLFSPDWAKGGEITVMTGEKLRLSLEGETNYVSLGDQKAQILRSDIALENGVLHIIDKVLVVPEGHKSNPFIQTLGADPTRTPGGSGAAASSLTGSARPTQTVSGASRLSVTGGVHWLVQGTIMLVWSAVL